MEKSITFNTYLIDYLKQDQSQCFKLVRGPKQLRDKLLSMGAKYLNGEDIGENLELNENDKTIEFQGQDGNDIFVHKFLTFSKAKSFSSGLVITVDFEDN